MATINLGRVKPVFRGAYNNSTAYVVDDIVTSSDETFICIQASTGNATSNATYWTKLAAKGTNGTDGTDVGTVITTQGDILYRDGSGLQRLAAGTSGQVLQTGGSGANPSWTTMSSDVVRLGSVTNTSASSVNIDHYSSTYNYYLHLVRMEQESFSDRPRIRVRQGGSTVTSSSYHYNWGGSQTNSGGSSNAQQGGTQNSPQGYFDVGIWNTRDTNHSKDLRIWVYHPTVTATNQRPYLQWESWGAASSSEAQHIQGFGYYDNATSWTGLNLFTAGSNSVNFSVVTYGYKHS
jgi:hypothetical protein